MLINVKYTVDIPDEHFKTIIKSAEELGYDFDDAGKITTVRRMLIREGIDKVEECVQGVTLKYE
jgi:hypothetical protein